MSINVSDIISMALTELGDPNGTLIKRPQMLGFYNRMQRRVAIECKCLEIDSQFDIVANEQRYAYPGDMIVLTGIRYSETPTDILSFYWLSESFKDEYRYATTRHYPTGSVVAYFARKTWFELISKPTLAIVGGGILSYAKVPALLTTETNALLELPDFHANFVQDGMMILARMTGRERVAAQQDLKNWELELQEMKDKMDDRSDDRRPAIRPPGQISAHMGQN